MNSNSLSIVNDNNEYIYIMYMNKTFKLWYKKSLWLEFADLYYDKMITIEKLFSIDNSKLLYNHIYNNETLEFNNIDVYKEIKLIIKNNLQFQLTYFEKNKILGRENFKESIEIINNNNITETKLQNSINENIETEEEDDNTNINISNDLNFKVDNKLQNVDEYNKYIYNIWDFDSNTSKRQKFKVCKSLNTDINNNQIETDCVADKYIQENLEGGQTDVYTENEEMHEYLKNQLAYPPIYVDDDVQDNLENGKINVCTENEDTHEFLKKN